MPTTSITHELMAVGRRFYDRGWVLGTSGNFSVVLGRDPLRLAITASSVHKGTLTERDILEVDGRGAMVGPAGGTPSAETLLHVEIAQQLNAGAVLHTHSVWSTVLSGASRDPAGMAIEDFEMLKGLAGVTTHKHREWVPILDNDQDMTRLSAVVGAALERNPRTHGFLLRRHGLYTWGATLADAERHVEIFEFLFEAIGRAATLGSPLPASAHGVSAKTQEAYHGAVESS